VYCCRFNGVTLQCHSNQRRQLCISRSSISTVRRTTSPYFRSAASSNKDDQASQNYDNSSPEFVMSDTRIPTDNFDIVTEGASAEITHLYAISAACTIPSYTPPTSSIKSRCNLHTYIISGRDVRSSKTPAFTLMWTSCTVPPVGKLLKVNHLVWLADRQQPAVIDVDDASDEMDSRSEKHVSDTACDVSLSPGAKMMEDADSDADNRDTYQAARMTTYSQ